jgi:hypothetical protein
MFHLFERWKIFFAGLQILLLKRNGLIKSVPAGCKSGTAGTFFFEEIISWELLIPD